VLGKTWQITVALDSSVSSKRVPEVTSTLVSIIEGVHPRESRKRNPNKQGSKSQKETLPSKCGEETSELQMIDSKGWMEITTAHNQTARQRKPPRQSHALLFFNSNLKKEVR